MAEPIIKYDSSFVAFIDILGYTKMIQDYEQSGDSFSLISKLSLAVKETKDFLQEGWSWEEDDFFVRVFSDCICISIPEKIENLDAFLQLLAYIQANLIKKEICLRGAAAIGKFFADENIIFSSGLIKAYEMEKSIAKFPRIIIPRDFWSYVIRNGYDEDTIWFKDEYIWVDYKDGQSFIDYMNFMPYNRSNDKSHNGRDLINHKIFIDMCLNKYRLETKLYEKYEWLANYHNSWCKYIYPEKSELLIRKDLTPNELGPFR